MAEWNGDPRNHGMFDPKVKLPELPESVKYTIHLFANLARKGDYSQIDYLTPTDALREAKRVVGMYRNTHQTKPIEEDLCWLERELL